MDIIEVVRARSTRPHESTSGVQREVSFESDKLILSKSTIPGGTVGGWHHHGTRELYAYVLSGLLRLEHGDKGELSVEVSGGDTFHVPTGLIHRDVNPDPSIPVVIVGAFLGGGEHVVNVSSPTG